MHASDSTTSSSSSSGLVRWFPFQEKSDARGSLSVIEGGRHVPFDIARVYYVQGTPPGLKRGLHAHKELQQVAVCVTGSCTMLLDDGQRRETVKLDTPGKGLLIPPRVWHEMDDFTPDCVLLVFAAAPYEEADYIRDYTEFKNYVQAPQL